MTDESKDTPTGTEEPTKQPGTLAVALSVIAAAFGVQTEANRQRDFSQTGPMPYIIGGLIFTVLFVLTLVGVVSLVLS